MRASSSRGWCVLAPGADASTVSAPRRAVPVWVLRASVVFRLGSRLSSRPCFGGAGVVRELGAPVNGVMSLLFCLGRRHLRRVCWRLKNSREVRRASRLRWRLRQCARMRRARRPMGSSLHGAGGRRVLGAGFGPCRLCGWCRPLNVVVRPPLVYPRWRYSVVGRGGFFARNLQHAVKHIFCFKNLMGRG